MTLTELVTLLRQITVKTSTPIIVDGTTGFSDEINELVNLPKYWDLEARAVEK